MRRFKVGLIGGGAREHAIGQKFLESPYLEELHLWPPNPVLHKNCHHHEMPDSLEQLAKHAHSLGVEVVVCGPEQPLAQGLEEYLSFYKIPLFGPDAHLSLLEASKTFAKKLMESAGVPTARYKNFSNLLDCKGYAEQLIQRKGGAVIKVDGLAGGKGVFVCHNHLEVSKAIATLQEISGLEADYLVEEILEGRECSYFVMVHQLNKQSMGFAVDFKRLENRDRGPNTGGMGAYSPVPWLPDDAVEIVHSKIVDPLLAGLKSKNLNYTGFLYCGLMWSEDGPKVVEFNVRLGDPEAQVLSRSDKSDWLASILQLLRLVAPIRANTPKTSYKPTIGVVLAAKGYPFNSPDKDKVNCCLPGPLFEPSPSGVVYAAGVEKTENGIFPVKGRVLTVVESSETYERAYANVYKQVAKVFDSWPHCHYRSDIGQRLLKENQ